MASAGHVHAVAHQLPEVDFHFFSARFLVPGAPRPQNLLHRVGEAVGIAQHQPVKLLPLRFRQIASLQRFQMQPDRRHRRLQFMGNRVDKAVMLLVAPDLAQQKNRVDHHAGDDERQKK